MSLVNVQSSLPLSRREFCSSLSIMAVVNLFIENLSCCALNCSRIGSCVSSSFLSLMGMELIFRAISASLRSFFLIWLACTFARITGSEIVLQSTPSLSSGPFLKSGGEWFLPPHLHTYLLLSYQKGAECCLTYLPLE